MMDNNFTYSKELAALRDGATKFHSSMHRRQRYTVPVWSLPPSQKNERPLNVYGYSKLVFDEYVRRLKPHV